MEAGSLRRYRFRTLPLSPPIPKSLPFHSLPPTFSPFFLNFRVSSSSSSSSSNSSVTNFKPNYRGPKPKRDWVADWVTQNDDAVRTLPIYVGAVSLLAVLLNRALSGIAPVADASRFWIFTFFISKFRVLIILLSQRTSPRLSSSLIYSFFI